MLDVNILIVAHRDESPSHLELKSFLDALRSGPSKFAVPELVLSAFTRIVTRIRSFTPSTTTEQALDFAAALRALPNCICVRPSENHWMIFDTLARRIKATGKLVPDVYLAAMAIDQGYEMITLDSDYANIPGLTWRHPLATHSATNPR